MDHMGSGDQFAELKSSHRDYKVFDSHYERIGKVGEIFVDDSDHPIYLGVSTGLLEIDCILIPMEIVRINDKRSVVEVDTTHERVVNAPNIASSDEISPDIEDRVRVYYGLKPLHSPEQSFTDSRETSTKDPLAFDERIDLVPGEREAIQEPFEGPPPYIERDEQLRRDRETPQRETARRDVRDTDLERDPAEPRVSEEPRRDSVAGDIPRDVRVRRIPR